MRKHDQSSVAAEGARRATGAAAARDRKGRFSARCKRATVLRLLRGEDLESVSRELGITAARASQWRDRFLAAGQVGPVRHASPEPPAVRGPLRRFLRRRQSMTSQNHPLARPPSVIDNYGLQRPTRGWGRGPKTGEITHFSPRKAQQIVSFSLARDGQALYSRRPLLSPSGCPPPPPTHLWRCLFERLNELNSLYLMSSAIFLSIAGKSASMQNWCMLPGVCSAMYLSFRRYGSGSRRL